jgi:hypothetical protein
MYFIIRWLDMSIIKSPNKVCIFVLFTPTLYLRGQSPNMAMRVKLVKTLSNPCRSCRILQSLARAKDFAKEQFSGCFIHWKKHKAEENLPHKAHSLECEPQKEVTYNYHIPILRSVMELLIGQYQITICTVISSTKREHER